MEIGGGGGGSQSRWRQGRRFMPVVGAGRGEGPFPQGGHDGQVTRMAVSANAGPSTGGAPAMEDEVTR